MKIQSTVYVSVSGIRYTDITYSSQVSKRFPQVFLKILSSQVNI